MFPGTVRPRRGAAAVAESSSSPPRPRPRPPRPRPRPAAPCAPAAAFKPAGITPVATDPIETFVVGLKGFEPGCAPLALSRNATIDAYVSADNPFGFSGGIDRRIRLNNSSVVCDPHELMNAAPASGGASPAPASVLPWHPAQ